MERKDKVFLILFLGIVSFSLLYLFQASYAKYRKKIEGNISSTIASWNIKINNETINNKTIMTNDITPTFVEDEYIKNGVIAPGSVGYFDIILNAEEVDVDFTYEIESSIDEENPLLDLIFTKYEIDGTTYYYDEDEQKLTGDLQKNTGDTQIRIYFKWNDEEDNQMDNKEDTDYSISANNNNTKIKVTIHFIQKKSTQTP